MALALMALTLLTLAILIGLSLRDGLLHRTLARRGEAVGHAVVVAVIVVEVDLSGLAPEAILGLLRGGDDAEIVLGVLQVAFRPDRIAGRVRIARQLQVFLADVVGRAPDLHVRPVRLEGSGERVGTLAIIVIVVAAAHTFVLTRSHR